MITTKLTKNMIVLRLLSLSMDRLYRRTAADAGTAGT
jgi:hypothetical protein